MSYDKVIDSARLDKALKATADAIRAKTGDSALITWNLDTGFADAIALITGGGEVDGLTANLLFELNSADISSSSIVWNDRSKNKVNFDLKEGTPNVTANGLLMTSCKVHGTKPVTLSGAFSYILEVYFENNYQTGAFFSFNQNNESKYCDNIQTGYMQLNGYSDGNAVTTLSVPQNELVTIALVRDTTGQTKVYKDGVLNGEYYRGTFEANGSYDVVLGASSWGGFPNHEGVFRIKSLRVYDCALTTEEINELM